MEPNAASHKNRRRTNCTKHQSNLEKSLKSIRREKLFRHGGEEIIDRRDYADVRNNPCVRTFSECKLRQPWQQEALHHYGRTHKEEGSKQTKKDCFNRREASVIESYFIQTFYPTPSIFGAKRWQARLTFFPLPGISITPISIQNKWLARMGLSPKSACQALAVPRYLLWSTWL